MDDNLGETGMEDIIIYGSGGMAKEVVYLIECINAVKPVWNIKGYIDDTRGDFGKVVNGYPILGTGDYLKSLDAPVNLVLAMSSPTVKESICHRIKTDNLHFPSLVHPSARVADNAVIGEGSIISIDCIISVNVNIGRHAFVNMRTVIGHDTVIEDYCSCLVNCIIAGDVWVGRGALLGSGCIIMEKTRIGSEAKIGMGSIVNFEVPAYHVVMTRPSKSMYFGN